MTMTERAVIFGASSGIGRATAAELTARGTKVWAVARTPGPDLIAGDATDPALCARVLDEADPDLVVVSVGVRPRMVPIDEQTWDDFSAVWNGDLKASFHVAQHTLRRPLRPGSTVVIVSSGAGLGGSTLSGGYAGAKRMQMFLAGYLQKLAVARSLGIRYVALVPKQLLTDTPIGEQASTAYAADAGITRAEYMMHFEAPLTAGAVAAAILAIAAGDAPAGPVLTITGARGLEAL
jgi:NAD(P)-dependent dehydrogenase (short-subunit alcohol dehydrogenase family)